MSSDTMNPPNASQHDPRHPKGTTYEVFDKPFIPQHLMNTTTPKKAGKVKRPNRSQLSASRSAQISDQENKMEPFTPPRPFGQAVPVSADASISVATSAKGKKKSNRPQTNGQAYLSSPATKKDPSPRAESSRLSMTPARASVLPAQAYAGPTFHASPAPSKLPIPRFFAKSLSPVEISPISKPVTQEHSSENSSMKSGDSPTTSHLLRVGEDQIRDASPLDIFFKADREEKAKRQLGAPQASYKSGINGNQISDRVLYAHTSSSPVPGPLKHYPRNVMDGPQSNVLPSEMDATERPKVTNAATTAQHPDVYRSKTSPSIMTTRTETDEQRKAKSLALKRLLMSPKPQLPPTSSVNNSQVYGSHGTPSPSPSPRPSRPFWDSPDSSTFNHTNALPHKFRLKSQQHIASSPTNHFTSTSATRPSQRRASSSYLCREVSSNSPNFGSNLPSTPTPYRSRNVHDPAISYNNLSAQLHRNISPPANGCHPFKSQADIQLGQARTNGNSDIEDALRKILKLDVLGSEGATGVRP